MPARKRKFVTVGPQASKNRGKHLGVSGPQFRLGENVLFSEVAPLVVETADRLSRDLGYGA